MERKIPGLFFMILLCTMMYSASITVTSPARGDIWYINDSYDIAWDTEGQMVENVRIRLLNHPALTVALNITNSTPYDQPFSWTVPSTVVPGFYRMRVRTTDGLVWGDSEVFEIREESITPPPPPPTETMPDLAIAFFEVFPKKEWLVVTQPVDCRFVVKNIGNEISRECQANLRVVGPRGFQTKNFPETIPELNPGQSAQFREKYPVPKHGIYRSTLTLDTDNKNTESDEGNNEKTIRFIVNPLADLIVCLPANRSVRRHVKKKIWASVKNIGFKQSPPCKLFWKVSQNWAKYINIPRLNPGETTVIFRHVRFRGLSNTGYIFAHIDAKFDVREINEFDKNKIAVTWRIYDVGGVIGGLKGTRKTTCSHTD